jgi:hypothetical protein
MTVKTQTTVEELKVRVRHSRVEYVLIDVIARTRVYQENIFLDMAVRQEAKPLETILAQAVDRPANYGGGIVVEPFENLRVGAGAVMVADEGQPTFAHDFVHAALRITSVAHDIAQAKCLVDWWAVAQHCVQRLPVGVDIREDRDPHAGFS